MPDFKQITNELTGLTDCFVAGGALTSLYTNKKINDIDVYPKSDKAFNEAIQWAFDEGYCNVAVSERAVTFVNKGTPVQIMRFGPFESADKIFEFFDFTCCMAAYDLDEKCVILHDDFLEHCSQRFLKFNPKTLYPYASAWRVKKYKEKGFTIGKFEYFKILMACGQKPVTSWDELKMQLGGIYGESVVVPDDVDFTTESMFDVLDKVVVVDSNMNGYSTAEEAIMDMSKEPMKYVPIGDQYFVDFCGNGDYIQSKTAPENGVIVPLTDVVPDMKFYKKVYLDASGIPTSGYKRSFKYPIGSIVESKEPYIFLKKSIYDAHTYYGGGTHVLEVKVDMSDLRLNKMYGEIVAARVVPIRILSQDEIDRAVSEHTKTAFSLEQPF